MNHQSADHASGRRSFLALATGGLGALFTAILGAPVVAYVFDPRNRQGASGDFRVVDGVSLSELQKDRPVQGVLRAVRRDAWTLHPNDVLGRVWIVLKKDPPAMFPIGHDASLLDVFTTICPHLGCSVNLKPNPAAGFACPCHAAQFELDGARSDTQNPAQRGMDTLDWRIEADPANADRRLLLVKYVNFQASMATPVEVK